MQRPLLFLALILLTAQTATASDTTGALVIFPIGFAVLGLGIGLFYCSFASRKHGLSIWLRLPLFAVAGVVAGMLAILLLILVANMLTHGSTVATAGNWREKGEENASVNEIPASFKPDDLNQLYTFINAHAKPPLTHHPVGVGLVRQGHSTALWVKQFPPPGQPRDPNQIHGTIDWPAFDQLKQLLNDFMTQRTQPGFNPASTPTPSPTPTP